MSAFESRLRRLEDRVQVPGPRTLAEEIALQEQILGACYGVREAALKILQSAEAGKYHGRDQHFPERFLQSAEVELIQRRKILREMTGDDDAAWEARLQRIEQERGRRAKPRRSAK